MLRISFDAIERNRTETLVPFSRDEILEGAAPILREMVGIRLVFALRQREARAKGFTWQWEDEEVSLSNLTMRAFARTGDPVWIVLAAGSQSQSLMSASLEWSTDAAGPASRRPSALTKRRVS